MMCMADPRQGRGFDAGTVLPVATVDLVRYGSVSPFAVSASRSGSELAADALGQAVDALGQHVDQGPTDELAGGA